MSSQFPRSTLLIYRDMIKSIKLFIHENRRSATLAMMRKEFEKNRKVKDINEIDKLKKQAAKAIADLYILNVKSQLPKDYKPQNIKY